MQHVEGMVLINVPIWKGKSLKYGSQQNKTKQNKQKNPNNTGTKISFKHIETSHEKDGIKIKFIQFEKCKLIVIRKGIKLKNYAKNVSH